MNLLFIFDEHNILSILFAGISIGYPTAYSHAYGYSDDFPQYMPQL